MWPEPGRFTPYQLPHSTEIAGLSTIYSGDDRYYNNVFLGYGADKVKGWQPNRYYGLAGYDIAKLPVWIDGNEYYNEASNYKDEINYVENSGFKPDIDVVEEGGNVYLVVTLDDSGIDNKTKLITTEMLGKAKMPNQAFENPDGSPLQIDTDYFGKKRNKQNPSVGPFENPGSGKLKLKVWY